MFDLKHNGSKWPNKSINQLLEKIILKAANGSIQALERLKIHTVKVTSLTLVVMDGNTKKYMQYLLSKTRHMVEFLKTSNIEKKKRDTHSQQFL